MNFLRKARTIVWGECPGTKEERRLLRKIDWFVLSFTCLNYWSNYLNRTNFQNAYVSGMKEDLNFEGNQYNIVLTVFTIGYIVGLIPSNLALQYIPARVWLPAMACIWGVLSACISKTTTVNQLYAIRFLTAIAESSTFSGTHYILGCWYKEEELGKRSAIFSSAAQMGSLFSGVMQGAIHTNMDGAHGISGWRWLFIIDGVLAVGIAIYGFLFFPDVPQTTKAWYLSEVERTLAISRLPPKPQTKMSWDLIKRCLFHWQWWGFSALFAVSSMLEALGFVGVFTLWLKAEGYPTAKINYYSLGLVAVAIVTTIIAAVITDHTKSRFAVNPFMSICAPFSGITLAVYDGVPTWLKFTAFCVSGAGYAGQATNFAWCNRACGHDDQLRAVTLASMNVWSNVLAAWWSLAFYPSTDAPKFRMGMVTLVVMAVLTTLVACAVEYMDRRQIKRDNDSTPILEKDRADSDGSPDVTAAHSVEVHPDTSDTR